MSWRRLVVLGALDFERASVHHDAIKGKAVRRLLHRPIIEEKEIVSIRDRIRVGDGDSDCDRISDQVSVSVRDWVRVGDSDSACGRISARVRVSDSDRVMVGDGDSACGRISDRVSVSDSDSDRVS